MHKNRLLFLIAFAIAFFSFRVFAGNPETVILLSFDGSRPDYFNPTDSPNFIEVGSQGWKGTLTSVFPSESFPNHATIITGCYTDQHGIVSNQFSDSVKGIFEYAMDPSWMNCEPIWAKAEHTGIKTAVTYWPLHGQGSWKGTTPTYQNPLNTTDIKKIIHFDDQEKINQIIAWLALPLPERPRFIFSWFADIDTAGHEHGPDSPEVKAAVFKYDGLLRQLLENIRQLPEKESVNLIIVSDHGMAEMKNEINAEALKSKLISSGIPATDFNLQASGTNSRLYLRTSEKIKHLAVKELKKIGRESRAFDVYENQSIPRKYHHRNGRTGDILLIGKEGFYFKFVKSSTDLIASVQGKGIGKHGYDPENESMKAAFFAKGPSFSKKAKPVSLRMTEVTPLIRKALQLEP